MFRYFCALTVLFYLGCTTISTRPVGVVPIRLYRFECGTINIHDISLWSPGVDEGQSKTLIASCYLIMHPKGNLLWDSGLADEIASFPTGLNVENMFDLYVQKPFLTKLREINIEPKDIKYVAFSHFHSDHVGNANAFVESTLLIREPEYKAAFGDDPESFRFDPQKYGQLKNSKVIKINGDHDVFGDGSVMIKAAYGHTPGHQVLLVKLPKSGPILLSGDLYHFTKNRTYKRVPSFNYDKEQTLQSMNEIEKLVEKNKATMWIQHDYEQNATLRQAPAYYE